MFIYTRKISKKKTKVILQESYRDNGKVRTRQIKYFGIAHNDEELKKLKQQAYAEKRKHQNKKKPGPKKKKVSIENLKETYRLNEGFQDVFGKLFDELKLDQIFSKIKYNQLKNTVIARIANPSSKLQTSNILSKDYKVKLTADQIYKLMDDLSKKEEFIKAKIFKNTLQLSSQKTINIVYFDVTTLYFESQKSDELKEFGYSKDGKKGEVQVVLALATTEEGLPLGYHLFPGNTSEVKTLLTSLSSWKKIVPIQNVRIVADRAMMSEDNLSQIEENNNQYVIAAKLKMLPKKLKKEILKMNKQKENSDHFTQEFTYKNRRLIVEYSHKRAVKDISDRERLIKKIKSKIGLKTKTKKMVTNNGYLKYMDEEKKGEVVFNEEKVKEEELWDGLHGIITNDFDSKAKDLLSQYKRLWIIEESFRINKHSLSMRPIYHYKPKRIKSHILICYLAFTLYRSLQIKLKQNNISMSLEKVRDELSYVSASFITDEKTSMIYRMPSSMTSDARDIYSSLEIKRINCAHWL